MISRHARCKLGRVLWLGLSIQLASKIEKTKTICKTKGSKIGQHQKFGHAQQLSSHR